MKFPPVSRYILRKELVPLIISSLGDPKLFDPLQNSKITVDSIDNSKGRGASGKSSGSCGKNYSEDVMKSTFKYANSFIVNNRKEL